MFVEQVEKNRRAAFGKLVARKGGVDVEFAENQYIYRTKRGIVHTYLCFDTFQQYRHSDCYPKQPERVDGFYFLEKPAETP